MPDFLDIDLILTLSERERYIQLILQFTHDLMEMEKLRRPYALIALTEGSMSIVKRDTTPLVCLREMRAYLKNYHKDLSDKEMEDILDAYQRYYGASELLCPRSLLHLSRWAVRNAMKYTGEEDHRVEQLDLPANLKSYLHLKW